MTADRLNIAGLAVDLERDAIADGQCLVYDASANRLVASDYVAQDVTISAAAESADVRAITMQVVDFDGAAKSGRFVVSFDVSDSQYGAPISTQTVTITTGTELREHVANQSYDVLTDSAGKIVVSVEVTGAASRYFHVWAAKLSESSEITWAGVAGPAGEWQFDDPVNSGQYVTVGF